MSKKKSLISGAVFVLVLGLSMVVLGNHKTFAADLGHQFAADVNGDGTADAITFDARSGDWWAAVSDGTTFENPSLWIHGFGVGSSRQFVANVGGGPGADLVTFDAITGDWWVALSNNNKAFQAPSRWIHGHGVGSSNVLLGDINGDGKSDAVAFFGNGSWWGATSNLTNNGFDAPGPWFSGGLGVGSTRQFLADVTGDGKADAVAFFNQTGDWWVSNSDGVHFATGPNRWAHEWGINSPSQFLEDRNGDGKADAIITDAPYGDDVFASLSNGSTFNDCGPLSGGGWVSSCERFSGFGRGASTILFADAMGIDKVVMVAFRANTGSWGVDLSTWMTGFGVGT